MFGIRSLLKLYDNNSVSVSGKKGRGKDMLTANIIARRKQSHYISNLNYNVKNSTFIPFDIKYVKTGNNFVNFIENDINPYSYPYPQNCDIYLSDCGIYFPSQYNNELNKKYKDLPTFLALSRQLGNCYVHTNSQALCRVWDKIREQSDTYINCDFCKVIGNLVVQKVTIYERFDSCNMGVPPFPMKKPLFSVEGMRLWDIERCRYEISYGKVNSKLLIYFNKSKYDTRFFKTILEGGKYEIK